MRHVARSIAAAALAATALAGATPAQAADRITICALTFVSSAPLFIAADKGYYEAEGLDAEIKFFRAATPVAVGVASDDCDFGVTGLTAGFFNLAGKGALKIIGAQSREEPGYDFVAFLASNKAYDAGLTDVKKLPGHSFGMTQVGSTFHYNVGMLAAKYGWDLKTIKLRPMQSVPNMLAAVKSGQIDMVAIPAHIAQAYEKQKLAHIVGWVHEHTPWQLGALFTSTKNVETRRAVVEKFIRAYQKAATDYYDAFNKLEGGKRVFGDEAEALIPILEKYTKTKPANIYAGAPYIDPLGRLKIKPIYEQVAWYKAHGLVDPSVDPKAFIDTSFIQGHLEPQ